MKKTKSILVCLALLGSVGFVSCTQAGGDTPSEKDVKVNLEISKTEISVEVGKTYTLTETHDGDKTASWSTSNSNVATVNNGVVTGVSAGTANITVSVGDESKVCVVTVTAPAPAPTLSLDKETASVEVGSTVTIVATAEHGTGSVTWESSAEGVATVEGGVVTGVAAGTATITAHYGALSATCVVTVSEPAPAPTLSLDKETASVEVGSTVTIVATAEHGTGSVTWESSAEGVATVDGGVVTGVAAGTATITARYGALSATCVVTVSEPAPAPSLSLDKEEASVVAGSTVTIVATAEHGTGSVTWESSDETVATVDGGVVTGVAAGEATITAHYGDLSAECAVTVSNKLINYTINYYLEGLDGLYVVDADSEVSDSADEGSTIVAEKKTFEGFTYDATNVNTVDNVEISETVNELKIYYTRNSYTVTVIGGSASKSPAKFGEEVTITPLMPGSTIALPEKAKGSLNQNKLTLGAEDAVVTCTYAYDRAFDQTTVLAANNSSATIKINARENGDLNGLIFGHVSANLAADGVERFYLLGVKNLKLGFYESQAGVMKLIKEAADPISAGVHTLKAEICADFSLQAYLDGEESIAASVGDITATEFSAIVESGRIGVYSESKVFEFSDLGAVSGAIDLATYKAACIAQGSTFAHDRYTAWFNPSTSGLQFETSLGESTALRNIGGYTEFADALIAGVTNATTLDEIDAAMAGHQQAIINAQVALTVYELGQIAPNIHAYGQVINNSATATDGNGVTLSGDPSASDGRWYTPACYKLRCSGFTCILDKLEAEAAAITTRAQADALASKYALDIARAACAREYEFVYWAKQNADPASVSSEWWYLYTYYGDSASFAYNGSVFTDQEIDASAGYRLNAIYYGASAFTTFNDTLNNFAWQIANQI